MHFRCLDLSTYWRPFFSPLMNHPPVDKKTVCRSTFLF
ncbi:hypothetical protein ES319_A02G069000v1 [Gossypium barbadense]|uniref:Uncharacterized protein n=1 Tax=Gossypium barbadense TaxID=3634 RepID=A0A5J5WLS8_GOSBA|nr:hypothetical protein ES319_A02G069000v1 [Gossypium barbadense]